MSIPNGNVAPRGAGPAAGPGPCNPSNQTSPFQAPTRAHRHHHRNRDPSVRSCNSHRAETAPHKATSSKDPGNAALAIPRDFLVRNCNHIDREILRGVATGCGIVPVGDNPDNGAAAVRGHNGGHAALESRCAIPEESPPRDGFFRDSHPNRYGSHPLGAGRIPVGSPCHLSPFYPAPSAIRNRKKGDPCQDSGGSSH